MRARTVKPTDRDRLLTLFRIAGNVPADPPHVADDDELLTAWRLGELTAAEDERFFGHLAGCAACRASVVAFAELLPSNAPEPVAMPRSALPSRRSRGLVAAAVAVAAGVAIATAWMLNDSTDATEVARARRELNEGRTEDALERLSGVRPNRLRTDAERAAFVRVQEEAAFRAGLADLKAGRFAEAAAHCREAQDRGVVSARLTKLYGFATAAPAALPADWEQQLEAETDPLVKPQLAPQLKD